MLNRAETRPPILWLGDGYAHLATCLHVPLVHQTTPIGQKSSTIEDSTSDHSTSEGSTSEGSTSEAQLAKAQLAKLN